VTCDVFALRLTILSGEKTQKSWKQEEGKLEEGKLEEGKLEEGRDRGARREGRATRDGVGWLSGITAARGG
jgi:hypothetical protein